MKFSSLTEPINIQVFGTIIHNIESDPEYFIPLIFNGETTRMYDHLLNKFRHAGRLELFASSLDDVYEQRLNEYLMERYNHHIKKNLNNTFTF